MTTSQFKARYANGVLTPLEPIPLRDGCEVVVTVEESPPAEPLQGLAGIAAMVKEWHESLPPDAWDDLPTDGAKNYKHYLYGHPKEDD